MHRRRQARDSPHVRGFQRQKRTEKEAAICGVHISIRPHIGTISQNDPAVVGETASLLIPCPRKMHPLLLAPFSPSAKRRRRRSRASGHCPHSPPPLPSRSISPHFSVFAEMNARAKDRLSFFSDNFVEYIFLHSYSPPPPLFLDGSIEQDRSILPFPFLSWLFPGPRFFLLREKKVFWRYKEDTH